jgi:hypothetical protein
MTSSTPPRLGRLPSALAALLAASLAPLLAACGGAAAQVQLPAKVAATTSAPAAAPEQALSPRQQVVVTFSRYTSAMAAAFESRSAAQVRQLLSPYLDEATISTAVLAFSQAWSRSEVSYGHAERHIIGVRIQGAAAWVHDCDDTSSSGLAYSGTGQVVPGTLGSPHENLVTRLNLVNGHWHIAVQTVEDVPCKP